MTETNGERISLVPYKLRCMSRGRTPALPNHIENCSNFCVREKSGLPSVMGCRTPRVVSKCILFHSWGVLSAMSRQRRQICRKRRGADPGSGRTTSGREKMNTFPSSSNVPENLNQAVLCPDNLSITSLESAICIYYRDQCSMTSVDSSLTDVPVVYVKCNIMAESRLVHLNTHGWELMETRTFYNQVVEMKLSNLPRTPYIEFLELSSLLVYWPGCRRKCFGC